ncbi:MAG: hypothetical protein RLZZ127_1865 [Planctomycetota bacterium]|jgi:hypothetical protein
MSRRFLFALWLLFAGASAPLAGADDGPGWTMAEDMEGITAFLAARRTEGVPALVILGVRACPPCREVYALVAELPQDLQRRVVGARVDESPDIAEHMPMGGLPWLIAVAADGRRVAGVAPMSTDELALLLTAGPPADPADGAAPSP